MSSPCRSGMPARPCGVTIFSFAATQRTRLRHLAFGACSLVAVGVTLPAVAAQGSSNALPTRAGFRADTLFDDATAPWGFAGFAVGVLPNDLFVAHGNELRLYDTSTGTTGLSHHVVHALPQNHDIGLLTTRAPSLELAFSDLMSDTLVTLDMLTLQSRVQPLPSSTFDLAIDESDRVFVSANPLWPAPAAANGVWLVDPLGGTAHLEIARLSGPSGPLGIDPRTGDLLVAVLPDVVPPAPGSVQVLRFTAAQVAARIDAGAPRLSRLDATVAIDRLDGAFDIEFDDRARLLISDVNARVIYRCDAMLGTIENVPFAGGSDDTPLRLQFTAGGRPTFDAFQPLGGGVLHVGATHYGVRSAVFELYPDRARLSTTLGTGTTVPPGASFELRVAGLPTAASGALCLSAAPAATFESPLLHFAGRPLWLGLDLAVPIHSVPLQADTLGTVAWTLSHPAGVGIALTVSLQAIAIDHEFGAAALISSNSLQLELAP